MGNDKEVPDTAATDRKNAKPNVHKRSVTSPACTAGKMHVLETRAVTRAVIRAHHIGRGMLRIDNNGTPIGLTSLLSVATLLLQPCNCL